MVVGKMEEVEEDSYMAFLEVVEIPWEILVGVFVLPWPVSPGRCLELLYVVIFESEKVAGMDLLKLANVGDPFS